MQPDKPRTCVIGAGSSGLPCIKALRESGVPVVCFEAGEKVGGNWVFGNNNGMSNIYRSLHINTSRTRMEFADFPMPEDYPDFPGHERIAAWFEDYADHFALKEHIRFNTRVTRAQQRPDDSWDIAWESRNGAGGVEHFDRLIVANGHHWCPRLPDPPFPGTFDGESFHSHDYIDPRDPVDMYDKNVLVLGMGNSAMDIASEVSRPGITRNTMLAGRRGAWIMPNYVFGKPLDTLPVGNPLFSPRVPRSLRAPVQRAFARAIIGDMTQYGLPQPEHDIDAAHPTVSSELPVKVGRGDVEWVGNIKELRRDRVLFTSGKERPVDVIVYCTGYRIRFPFFDESFLSAEKNDIRLYKRVIQPDIDNLYFVGLVQPLGALMPLAEQQAKWIADLVVGRGRLPDRQEMARDIERDWRTMNERYLASTRHTIQVDFDEYLFELKQEQKASRKRAARAR